MTTSTPPTPTGEPNADADMGAECADFLARLGRGEHLTDDFLRHAVRCDGSSNDKPGTAEPLTAEELKQWRKIREDNPKLISAAVCELRLFATIDQRDDRITQLERNLNSRDDFILNKGLWGEFMDSLR